MLIGNTGRCEAHELVCQLLMGSSSPAILGGSLAHCEVVIRINKCSFISVSAQGITNTVTRIFNWRRERISMLELH